MKRQTLQYEARSNSRQGCQMSPEVGKRTRGTQEKWGVVVEDFLIRLLICDFRHHVGLAEHSHIQSESFGLQRLVTRSSSLVRELFVNACNAGAHLIILVSKRYRYVPQSATRGCITTIVSLFCTNEYDSLVPISSVLRIGPLYDKRSYAYIQCCIK